MTKTLAELKADFIKNLELKNYGRMTRFAYAYHLEGFFRFLEREKVGDAKRVGKATLIKYVQGLYAYRNAENKPYKSSSICIMIRSVKRFFEWLEKTGQILIDPSQAIKEPKKEKSLPGKALSAEEVKKLLDHPDLNTLMGIRDKAILEVFYSTGVRRSEMISLKLEDVSLKDGTIRINNGKGGYDRVVPLGEQAGYFLKAYLEKVRPRYAGLSLNPSEALWLAANDGEPMSVVRLEQMVLKRAKKAGIERVISPHALRHTFATELIKGGASVVAVARMLGHQRLGNTQRYTQMLERELKAVHQLKHPAERQKEQENQIPVILKKIQKGGKHAIPRSQGFIPAMVRGQRVRGENRGSVREGVKAVSKVRG